MRNFLVLTQTGKPTDIRKTALAPNSAEPFPARPPFTEGNMSWAVAKMTGMSMPMIEPQNPTVDGYQPNH